MFPLSFTTKIAQALTFGSDLFLLFASSAIPKARHAVLLRYTNENFVSWKWHWKQRNWKKLRVTEIVRLFVCFWKKTLTRILCLWIQWIPWRVCLGKETTPSPFPSTCYVLNVGEVFKISYKYFTLLLSLMFKILHWTFKTYSAALRIAVHL